MPSLVLLIDDAVYDLEEMHNYIARHDSIGRANHVLERIEEVLASLSESPQRGSYPKELLDVGIRRPSATGWAQSPGGHAEPSASAVVGS